MTRYNGKEDGFIVHSFTDGSGVLYAGVMVGNIPDLLNTFEAEIAGKMN